MYRALPVPNKLIYEKEKERLASIHVHRIVAVKPSIDMETPKTMLLPRLNAKKRVFVEERNREINRTNALLLNKIGDILQRDPKEIKTFSKPIQGTQRRKLELERINQENASLLKRILSVQPSIDHLELKKSHKQHLSRLKNCAEFPVVVENVSQIQPNTLSPPGTVKIQASPLGKSVDPSNLIGTKSPSASSVHKENKGSWMLEMCTDGRSLTISASNGLKTLELLVSEKNHRKLFRETHGNYADLSKRVKISKDAITILEMNN
jgi:Hemingway/CFA97